MKKHGIAEYVQLIESHNLLIYHDLPRDTAKKIIQKVAYNSNKVASDTLFICKGLGFKEEYLDMAIRKGAIMYIS